MTTTMMKLNVELGRQRPCSIFIVAVTFGAPLLYSTLLCISIQDGRLSFFCNLVVFCAPRFLPDFELNCE